MWSATIGTLGGIPYRAEHPTSSSWWSGKSPLPPKKPQLLAILSRNSRCIQWHWPRHRFMCLIYRPCIRSELRVRPPSPMMTSSTLCWRNSFRCANVAFFKIFTVRCPCRCMVICNNKHDKIHWKIKLDATASIKYHLIPMIINKII